MLKPHTSLNLTCLGCFMLPTTAYESNFGSQVARKFVNHRPTWLSCLSMEEGNIKNLQFIFILFSTKTGLICKESGRRRTGKLRSFAQEISCTIWAFNRKYEAYGERGFTIGPMISRAFRFEQKERNLQHILIAYPLPHRMTGKIDGVARILNRSTNQHFYNKKPTFRNMTYLKQHFGEEETCPDESTWLILMKKKKKENTITSSRFHSLSCWEEKTTQSNRLKFRLSRSL